MAREARDYAFGGRTGDGTVSERKEQAIYDAVHEEVMQLRIALQKEGVGDRLDAMISQAGHAAGMAAISAYRQPLKRKRPK